MSTIQKIERKVMYSIRFNEEIIHECLPKEECEMLLDKYKENIKSITNYENRYSVVQWIGI